MGWGEAIAGIAAGISALNESSKSAEQQYQYQRRLQVQQQKWLERMSNTAHQREKQDLLNAGLNPILTATGGNGASTPSSGMGQISAQDRAGAMEKGITSAMQLKQLNNQTKLNNAQTQQIKAQAKNLNAQTDTEATKQIMNMATSMNQQAQALLNQKEVNAYDKKLASMLKEQASKIALNYGTANANQINARANMMNANASNMNAYTNYQNMTNAKQVQIAEIKAKEAETKYTNEKSRGYGVSLKLGPFSFSKTGDKNRMINK